MSDVALPTLGPDLGLAQQLAFEIALDWKPVAEVFADHGISESDGLHYLNDERFQAQIARYHTELQDRGDLFKIRASIAAGRTVEVVYRIAHSQDVSANTRLDAAKTLAKWGGHEDSAKTPQALNPGINLVMNILPPTDIQPVQSIPIEAEFDES